MLVRRDHEYFTTFGVGTENPIAEGGRWQGGLQTCLDWTDIQTSGRTAYGTQTGSVGPPYNDSTAFYLPPNKQQWADMEVEAQLGTIANRGSWTGFHEVELLLRAQIGPNTIKMYEVLFSAQAGPTYVEIVKWNGPVGVVAGGGGAFTSLAIDSAWGGMNSNDWIKATVIGSVIRAWHRPSTGGAYTNILTYDTASDVVKYTMGFAGHGSWKNGTSNLNDYPIQSWRARPLI